MEYFAVMQSFAEKTADSYTTGDGLDVQNMLITNSCRDL